MLQHIPVINVGFLESSVLDLLRSKISKRIKIVLKRFNKWQFQCSRAQQVLHGLSAFCGRSRRSALETLRRSSAPASNNSFPLRNCHPEPPGSVLDLHDP